jgi:hypothetical protein
MNQFFQLNTFIYIIVMIGIIYAIYSFSVGKYTLLKSLSSIFIGIVMILLTYVSANASDSLFMVYLILAPILISASVFHLWYTDLRKK